MEKEIAIEVIDSDILADYMPYMTNDEIVGCDTGKFVGLGAFDVIENKVLGLCIVEVLPEFILIHDLKTVSDEDANDVEKRLITFIKEDPMLPIHMFVSKDNKDECKKMEKLGFQPEKSGCYYMEGKLSNMAELPTPDKNTSQMKAAFVNQYSEEELLPFILNSPHNRFLQIPWDSIDNDRFGDGIVCTSKGKVSAVLLCEEDDDRVMIPWFHGISEQTTDACFFVLKNVFSKDNEGDINFRFICTEANQKESPDKYFKKMKKSEIYLFRLT